MHACRHGERGAAGRLGDIEVGDGEPAREDEVAEDRDERDGDCEGIGGEEVSQRRDAEPRSMQTGREPRREDEDEDPEVERHESVSNVGFLACRSRGRRRRSGLLKAVGETGDAVADVRGTDEACEYFAGEARHVSEEASEIEGGGGDEPEGDEEARHRHKRQELKPLALRALREHLEQHGDRPRRLNHHVRLRLEGGVGEAGGGVGEHVLEEAGLRLRHRLDPMAERDRRRQHAEECEEASRERLPPKSVSIVGGEEVAAAAAPVGVGAVEELPHAHTHAQPVLLLCQPTSPLVSGCGKKRWSEQALQLAGDGLRGDGLRSSRRLEPRRRD